MRDLRNGLGTTDGRRGAPPFPRGIQAIATENEGQASVDGGNEGGVGSRGDESGDSGNPSDTASGAWGFDDDKAAYAMVAGITETEALEPTTIEEARRWPDWAKWDEAIKAELRSLDDAHTWDVVERPTKTNVVSCKWVFKVKKNAAGEVDKYKARLVARGFTQQLGVDYDETYAPVARLASIRLILAIAARQDWDVDVFDFHSAFLNGKLDDDEIIYMELPPGFDKDGRDLVAKLCVALYRSKQGALKWYQRLSKVLGVLGFKRMEADWGVFVALIGAHILILASHVDDCTITGSSDNLIKSFKAEIGSRFRITDLGPISWLLGMKITRDRSARTISLSQEPYINAILARFNFVDAKPVATPLDPNVPLSESQSPRTTSEVAKMRNIPYRQATGSLIYLVAGTRPDIAFATSYVCQYNGNPGWAHWEAVKRIYRYLLGTKSLTLTYGTETRGLVGYIDADGASQEHRHAITGFAFLIDGGAILWGSRKQELVTLSTAESEYVAVTHAAKEAIWLRCLINEVFRPLQHPTILYGDNQAAIALTKDGSFHACTKHIDIHYHFIRFSVEQGHIRFLYCPTNSMIADTLTKALPSTKAKHFAFELGLRPSV